ncbi:MAG: hypothetical protein EBU70_14550 [Actinobacteria bacterium]|nr:hypothetical protein [Actinomycetota bacterium]
MTTSAVTIRSSQRIDSAVSTSAWRISIGDCAGRRGPYTGTVQVRPGNSPGSVACGENSSPRRRRSGR